MSRTADRPAVSRNVIALGWVSFCTDLASEMLYPVIPLFVVGVLGAGPAALGMIEGIAEGGSTALRWVAGAMSDRFRRRKPFIVAGYGISAVSKPVMGLAAYGIGWPLFLVGRAADRLGKSVRTSARDALIADSTHPSARGAAFGLHRAMDTCGAVLGPLAAVLIHATWPGFPLAGLFFVALVPGLVSVLLAAVVVRDVPHQPRTQTARLVQPFPARFWRLLVAVLVFSLGNSSDAFLILRANELGLGFARVVLAFALYNAVYAATALPLGRLSDRVGRKPVIIVGWLWFAAVYLAFAAARRGGTMWPLFAAYGLYQALSEGISKAMVSDIVPPQQRAGAIGLFYTVSGAGQLVASVLAGWLWPVHAGEYRLIAAFLLGSICAVLAVPLIASVPLTRGADTMPPR